MESLMADTFPSFNLDQGTLRGLVKNVMGWQYYTLPNNCKITKLDKMEI